MTCLFGLGFKEFWASEKKELKGEKGKKKKSFYGRF